MTNRELGFERLGTHALEPADRTWVGNDESARNQHGVMRLDDSPVLLSLSWRASGDEPAAIIGCFRLDLPKLLRNGLIRTEKYGTVRVRFIHEPDRKIYLQVRRGGPRIEVGRR